MKKILLGTILSIYSSLTIAYGSVDGKVVDVRIDRSGVGIIKFDKPITRQPAQCRIAPYTSHLSFDANTEGGKAIYSMALTALATGKRVSAIGTGHCNEYTDVVEGLSYWHIHE